jgi:tRNA(Ile)-lysidine synthetase-like protein
MRPRSPAGSGKRLQELWAGRSGGILQLGEEIWAERIGEDLLLARCRGPHWQTGQEWSEGLDFTTPGRDVTIVRDLPQGGVVAAAAVDADQLARFMATSPGAKIDGRDRKVAAEIDGWDRKVAAEIDGRYRTVIDISGREDTLGIRYGRQGDTMRPFGMAGRKQLADLFSEERVPRLRRGRLPVVEADGTILWVGGVRTAEEARVGPETRKAVTLQFRISPI